MTTNVRDWKADFFAIWTGQAFSLLGSAMVQFAIIWWITVTTGSATVLTLASLAGLLPQALLGPVAGVLVDRWDRRTIMIIADLGIALASLGLAAIFLTGEPQVWHIYAVLAVRSLGTAFHWPAMDASVPLIVPADQLSRTAGLNQALRSAANIAGPALGALAVAAWPMASVILIDVIGAVIASATLLCVPIPRPARAGNDAHGRGMLAEMAFGYRALRDSRGLYALTIASSVCAFLYIPVGALFPLMVIGHFGGTAVHSGIVEAAFGAGMLAGSLAYSAWGGSWRKVRTIIVGMVGMGATLVFMGLLPPGGFPLFAVASGLLGFSAPLFNAPFIALVQTRIDPAVLGRVFAFIGTLMTIATPLGLVAAGPGAKAIGVPLWFALSGVLIAATGLAPLAFPAIADIDRESLSPEGAAEGPPTGE